MSNLCRWYLTGTSLLPSIWRNTGQNQGRSRWYHPVHGGLAVRQVQALFQLHWRWKNQLQLSAAPVAQLPSLLLPWCLSLRSHSLAYLFTPRPQFVHSLASLPTINFCVLANHHWLDLLTASAWLHNDQKSGREVSSREFFCRADEDLQLPSHLSLGFIVFYYSLRKNSRQMVGSDAALFYRYCNWDCGV